MNDPAPTPKHFTRRGQILEFMLVDGKASRMEYRTDPGTPGGWYVTNGKETATATSIAASYAAHRLRRVEPETKGERPYYTAS